MTSLPISAHPRPPAPRLAQRLNRPAQNVAGLQGQALQRRTIDATAPIRARSLPGSTTASTFVAAAILCLLTAALLLDIFWTRADLLHPRSLLQGVMLAGLAGLAGL